MDGNDISLKARTFTNSGMVDAKRNIAIRTTESFSNLPVGKVPVVEGIVSTGEEVVVGVPVRTCGTADPLCVFGFTQATVYEITQTVKERLDTPFPARKGRIIAGAGLDIDYGRRGGNTAALLSAPTLKIHSSDSNAQAFVNQDLHLDQYQISWRWKEIYTLDDGFERKESYSYAYPASASDYLKPNGEGFSRISSNSGDAHDQAYRLVSDHTLQKSFDAGIFANILVVEGGTLINRGSPLSPKVDPIGGKLPGREAVVLQPGSAGTASDPLTGLTFRPIGPAASAQPFQGLNLSLPINPNGFFVPAKDPAARYLIETNPLFVDGSANANPLPGADYLAELLGYKPDEIQKRLGDASYEARLIRDQIVAQTGSNLLRQQADEAIQFRVLMEQGAAQSATLGLTFGKGLTSEQIARLEQDLVWMVEEDVGGTSVLVPVVYLARSTREAIVSGPVIEALDMRIRTAALQNHGGTIRGGTVDIATAGDVQNLSGTIAGRSVAVQSGTGSVRNETHVDHHAMGNVGSTLGKRAVIASQDGLAVSAARDVALTGATLAAGGDATIVAGGNLDIQSASRLQASRESRDAGSDRLVRSETQVASDVGAGGALAARSGADLMVKGSSLKSGKDMSLEAGRHLGIVALQDTTTEQGTTTSSGAGVGDGVAGRSSTAATVLQGRNVASSVSSGGKLGAAADGELLVRGSSLDAQGDVHLEADNVRIEDGRNLDVRTSRTETTTYLKLSSQGKTGATANAKAASESASATSDSRSTQADGREAGSTTATSTRSASSSSEIETGKAVTPDPKREAADQDVSASDSRQKREVTVDDRGNRIVSAVDTQNTASSRRADDGRQNMSASSSSASREDSIVTTGKPGSASGGSTNDELAARGSAAAAASAGASAEASGKAGLALAESTSTVERTESQQSVASTVASGGNLTISGRREVTLKGAKLDAAGDAAISGEQVNILATQDVKTSSSASRTTSVGFLVDSENKAEAAASAKADAQGSARLATGAGAAVPDKLAADVRGSAAASGEARAGARSQNNIDIVRDLQTGAATKEVLNQASAIQAGGDLRIAAGDKLKVESGQLEGDRQVALKANDMEFLATQDVKESSSTSSKTSGGLYADGAAGAQAKGSAALKGEVRSSLGNHGMLNQDSAHAGASGSLDAKGSATADAKGGAGLQFRHETAEQQQSAGTARVTTIRSGSGDISRSAGRRIVDVGTKIDAAGDFSQEAQTIDSRAASNTGSSSSKTQSDAGKLGVYGKANAEASGNLQLSGGVGAGYTGNTLDKENKTKTVLDANAGAGIEAEYAHKDSSKSASSSTAVVSSITAGGKLASKSADATTLEGTRMTGKDVDLQAGSLDMKAARNTGKASEQETEGKGKLNAGVNAGTGSPVTGGLSGSFDRTGKSAETSDAVVGSIEAGRNVSIRTRDDARMEGASVKAGGNVSMDVGGKLDIAAAQSTSSASEEKIHGALALSATKSDSGSEKGMALEGAYAKKTDAASKAVVGDIAAGGDLALSTGGDARLEGTRIAAGGNADMKVGSNLKFDAARETSHSESLNLEGSLKLGAETEKNLEKKKQTDSGSFGISAEGQYEKSAVDKAVTGAISAGGDVRVHAGGDAALEGTDLRAGKQASVSAGRDLTLKAATDTAESMKFSGELALCAGSKTVSTLDKDGAAAPDNTADTRKAGLDFSGDYARSDSKRGGTVQAGAGGAELAAGRDLGMQGGSVKSGGDVALKAAGDLNLGAATSTANSIGASLNAAQATTRNTVNTDKDKAEGKAGAAIRGATNEINQGTAINSGGRIVLKSGGATSMTNTESTAARGVVTETGKGVKTATLKDRKEILNLGVSKKNSSAGAALAQSKDPAWKPAAPSKGDSPPRPANSGTGKVQGPVISVARAGAKAGTPALQKAGQQATAKKPVKQTKPVIGHARKTAAQSKPVQPKAATSSP